MELGAIVLLLVVVAIIVLFMSQPFSGHWLVKAQSAYKRTSLSSEPERALYALQELDFDYSLGKVSQDDYSVQRANLLRKGADVLRRLHKIQSTESLQSKEPAKEKVVHSQASMLSDEDLEELIAKRRTEHGQKTAGFCPKCGKPILQSDQFCPTCGLRIYSR